MQAFMTAIVRPCIRLDRRQMMVYVRSSGAEQWLPQGCAAII